MKLIYEASNSIEAHMILDLLEQAGLKGRVDGEHLQGGMGELQATGIVRVMIEESDYDDAKKIVAKWDATQPDSNEKISTKKSSPLFWLLFGGVIGMLMAFYHFTTPITHDGIDYNDDGIFDEKWTYKNGLMSRAELDRNLDGEIDLVYFYDRQGLIDSSKLDENFDGFFESNSKFRNGNTIWSRSDVDKDGFYEYFMHFDSGTLKKIEFLSPNSKKIVKIQYYNGVKLLSAELDTDNDGKMDIAYQYNEIEEVAEKSNL